MILGRTRCYISVLGGVGQALLTTNEGWVLGEAIGGLLLGSPWTFMTLFTCLEELTNYCCCILCIWICMFRISQKNISKYVLHPSDLLGKTPCLDVF